MTLKRALRPARTDQKNGAVAMNDTFPPSADMSKNAHVDSAKYDAMYAASIADPDAFWQEQGTRVDWIKPFTALATSISNGTPMEH
jgi:hypothetical protein